MNKIDLITLRDRAYKIACDHGFHETEHSDEHYLMLVITELSEAVEADRKSKRSQVQEFLKDPAITHLKPDHDGVVWRHRFETYIKDTLEDELADAVIRLFDLAGLRKIDISFPKEWIGDMSVACEDETFTESVYEICGIPCKHQILYSQTIDHIVNYMLASILGLAEYLGINLLLHIEYKMIYNESRIKKHGKKY